ncbi:hypothetical protein [Mesorhizobium sp. M8A.F.Ca.ET.021.01.1.1]|uniref:hypothetical protein n=1 Tax=Mesorhizobium sp. M8A.F.Ca.ET.021.01.1.1 TaxID=2496757 RepID=UPI000FCCA0E9|nr:hypothetical protein [Mesorhizobium sp. M8A.F.Ca.ET.021.01.1.1]RUW57120.1 hypothetical protein EOA36_00625 [Mesorhizobium sp. M8A.F.Ca.ET.021.01.1.1]
MPFIVLNNFDARVVTHLQKNGPLTPTQIGCDFKFKNDPASHVTKPIRRLLALGLIRKESTNKRLVQYRCIKVLPPLIIAEDPKEKVYIKKTEIADDPSVPGNNPMLPDALKPPVGITPQMHQLLGRLDKVSGAFSCMTALLLWNVNTLFDVIAYAQYT